MAAPGSGLWQKSQGAQVAAPAAAPAASTPGVGLWAQATQSAGGTTVYTTPAPKKKNGGLFGFVHSIPGVDAGVHGLETGANAVASTAAGIATGTIDYGAQALALHNNPSLAKIGQEWADFIRNPLDEARQEYQTDPFVKSTVQQVAPLAHPRRDPVQTALAAALLVAPGLASGVARGAYLGKVASAARVAETGDLVVAGSDAAKAASAAGHTVEPLGLGTKAKLSAKTLNPRNTPPTTARILKVPKVVTTQDSLSSVLDESIQLPGSASHLVRAGQSVVDKGLQTGLSRPVPLLTKIANKRVAGTIDEGNRITQEMKQVQVGDLVSLSGRAGRDRGLTKEEAGMAAFLKSNQVMPHEAVDYWTNKATQTAETQQLAKIAQAVDAKGILHLTPVSEAGHASVEVADNFPKLGKAVAARTAALDTRENILTENNIMSSERITTRGNLVRDMIVPGEGLVDRAPGRYTPLETSVKGSPKTLVAQARTSTSVLPEAKKLSPGKTATGAGVVSGRVPLNPVRDTAVKLHQALRYQNTVDFRKKVVEFGHDARNSKNDILVRDPSVSKGAIPENIEELLGRKTSTLSRDEQKGLATALKARLEDDFLHHRDESVGTKAPEGYKWVDKHLIPSSVTETATARTGLTNVVDTVNGAITAATVYFRVGHLPTRLMTNAVTNVIEGSARPIEIGRSASLARELSETERRRLLAATGVGGSKGVLPSEVQRTLPAKGVQIAVGKGAQLWHKNVDAPFRLNSILYEFRNKGITTPQQIRDALNYLEDPAKSKIGAAQASKIDWAVRRARRASIMYDGLSNFERRYVARALWFYPWTKGALRFAGHTVAEHPAKSYAIVQAGQYGAKQRQAKLGDVPSYELGLTPLGKAKNGFIKTANFESYTPFSTTGQVAEMIAHPLNPDLGALGDLNPALSGTVKLLTSNSAGKAVQEIAASTPESQIASASIKPRGKGLFPTSSKYLFGSTGKSQIARAFIGAGLPRKTNIAQLHKDAYNEKHPGKLIRIRG